MGARIKLHSLQRAPELNGLHAEIVEPHDRSTGRWGVKIDTDGRIRALRTQNLRLIDAREPAAALAKRMAAEPADQERLLQRLEQLAATDDWRAVASGARGQGGSSRSSSSGAAKYCVCLLRPRACVSIACGNFKGDSVQLAAPGDGKGDARPGGGGRGTMQSWDLVSFAGRFSRCRVSSSEVRKVESDVSGIQHSTRLVRVTTVLNRFCNV